jgi:bacterioferritin
MGKVAREIVKNADEIVERLNKALADEWLAYMQYLFAASIVPVPAVERELKDIAKEELEHAEELTDRIIQLGGKPLVDPKGFFEMTNCGYAVPTEDAMKVVKDAIKGEGCAIRVYEGIADLAKATDPITYNRMLHIMEEEIEHEQRFENLLDWLG